MLLAIVACADPETGTGGAAGKCGDALPAEGSLCAQEGQKCAPDELGCGLFTGVECKGGVWVHYEVGTGQCTGTDGYTAPTTDASGDTDPEPVPCGDEVPQEGTPCDHDAEDCAPDADLCAGYVGAQCSGGQWMRYTVEPVDPGSCGEPVACAVDTPPGSACTVPGERCAPGCEDMCAGCNGLECVDGRWQVTEPEPGACAPDCDAICAAVLAPMCPAGPSDAEACAGQCEAQAGGRCKEALQTALACAGERPTFSCDGDERPTVAGCEAQFEALRGCQP